ALWQVEKAGRPRGPLFQDVIEDDALAVPSPFSGASSNELSTTSYPARMAESPLSERMGASPLPEQMDASPLPDMMLAERLGSDLRGTGLTVGPHPMALYRQVLRDRGVVRAADLAHIE